MSPTVWMSPAVTSVGPVFFTTMRLGPSPCILMAMSLMLRMMSVTSSRTPAMEENSWRTPSMCTDCTLAPCKEESRIRRSALPSVNPKPRSSGSATTVAEHFGSGPGVTWSLFGRISSCQFFWIVTSSPIALSSTRAFRATNGASWEKPAWRQTPAELRLHAPALARPTTVMRNRRHVADRRNGEAGRLQGAQCRFATRPRTRNLHFKRAHAVLLGLARNILARHLGCVRRRFARPLEAHGAGRRPGNRVALGIGNCDHRIIECRVHVGDARSNVLAFTPPDADSFFTHSQPFRDPPQRTSHIPELLLLAGDRLGWTFAGPRVGVGALAANRQTAPMPYTPIATE